jgi:hypothetical protein
MLATFTPEQFGQFVRAEPEKNPRNTKIAEVKK